MLARELLKFSDIEQGTIEDYKNLIINHTKVTDYEILKQDFRKLEVIFKELGEFMESLENACISNKNGSLH